MKGLSKISEVHKQHHK